MSDEHVWLVMVVSRLAHLSLSINPLGARPLRRIARAAASCDSLVSLSLERTAMDTEAASTGAQQSSHYLMNLNEC